MVKNWALEQKIVEKSQPNGRLEILPESMPHLFNTILTALVQENMLLSQRQKGLKQHLNFRPREFPWLLANALNGNPLSFPRLRQALKYREVSFYKEASLTCKGWEPYFQMVCSLADTRGQEARFKIKALIRQLDLDQQKIVLEGQ